jgi:hypothetical protein
MMLNDRRDPCGAVDNAAMTSRTLREFDGGKMGAAAHD